MFGDTEGSSDLIGDRVKEESGVAFMRKHTVMIQKHSLQSSHSAIGVGQHPNSLVWADRNFSGIFALPSHIQDRGQPLV